MTVYTIGTPEYSRTRSPLPLLSPGTVSRCPSPLAPPTKPRRSSVRRGARPSPSSHRFPPTRAHAIFLSRVIVSVPCRVFGRPLPDDAGRHKYRTGLSTARATVCSFASFGRGPSLTIRRTNHLCRLYVRIYIGTRHSGHYEFI